MAVMTVTHVSVGCLDSTFSNVMVVLSLWPVVLRKLGGTGCWLRLRVRTSRGIEDGGQTQGTHAASCVPGLDSAAPGSLCLRQPWRYFMRLWSQDIVMDRSRGILDDGPLRPTIHFGNCRVCEFPLKLVLTSTSRDLPISIWLYCQRIRLFGVIAWTRRLTSSPFGSRDSGVRHRVINDTLTIHSFYDARMF
jgi:hypothetical protein